MLTVWIGQGKGESSPRALVVFIDDLDRCRDKSVMDVCDAIKLYLDAPGLIFVIACDQSVLARGVSLAARGGEDEGRDYLEKIIQVAYRLPQAHETQIRRLIQHYAKESKTTKLIDDRVTDLLLQRTDRNPRRIKRIINSFVLTYRLDRTWRAPELGGPLLMTATLLQHLYPDYYALLIRETAADPIGDLLTYASIKAERFPRPDDDEGWSRIRNLYTAYDLEQPADHQELMAQVDKLKDALPEIFPRLAGQRPLIDLLSRSA